MLYLRKNKPLLVSNYVGKELDWYQGDDETNYNTANKPVSYTHLTLPTIYSV